MSSSPSHQADRTLSQSVLRALDLLEEVGEHRGLGVGELAERIEVNRTIVGRLLKTLEVRGYVVRDDRQFRLGPRLLGLVAHADLDLRQVARPVLQQAAGELGLTVQLVGAEADEAVVVAVAEPEDTPFHMSVRAGARRPLGRGASGIALLAARAPRDGEDPRIGDSRARGWSTTYGDVQRGAGGVATWVRRAPAYCVGVVASGEVEDADRVARTLLDAADRIGALLHPDRP
ncbi:helix-turn-helix domain-containing protein [Nocardioides sp. W7]|uniref:IclR family transcriptional regulator n=1 Tax=Nocardioides sp. W7 TaxID=2931390 RepID=UPI001FD290A6|nr:helix-turn-helix domain-containing protein [Nocardioides sp. W7]